MAHVHSRERPCAGLWHRSCYPRCAAMPAHHLPHNPTADPKGHRIGLLAAVLAVAVAIMGIGRHRAHTDAILHLSAANHEWARYEVAKLKSLNLELGETLGRASGANGLNLGAEKRKYEQEAGQIQSDAERSANLADSDERLALRFDIGEGLLEVAVFLTSLYFLSPSTLFPFILLAFGVAAVLVLLPMLSSRHGRPFSVPEAGSPSQ